LQSALEVSVKEDMPQTVRAMPSVFVVPVYVEVPAGFERAISTLESILQRAGYRFYTGQPLFETLEEATRALASGTMMSEADDGTVGTGISS
jgi:hypothetical protein